MIVNQKTKLAVFRKIDFVDQQQSSLVSDKNNKVTSIICRICGGLISKLDINKHAREHELLPQFLPIKEVQEFFEILQVTKKMTDDKNETKKNNSSVIDVGEGASSYSGPGKDANKICWTLDPLENTMENGNVNFFDREAYTDYILSGISLYCQDKNCQNKNCLKQKVVSKSQEHLDKPKCENLNSDKQKLNQEIQKEERPKKFTTNTREKIKRESKFPKSPEKIKYVCSTCDVKMYEKNYAIIHLNGQQHKSKQQQLKFELNLQQKNENEDINLPTGVEILNGKFNCKVCKLMIDGIEDLLMHLEDLDHQENLGNMYIDSDPLEIIHGFPRGIKPTKLSEIYYCAICCCTIKNYKNVNLHTFKISHDITLNHFLGRLPSRDKTRYISRDKIENVKKADDYPDEIKMITDNSGYYCEACNCKIKNSFEGEIMDTTMKVWQHINGRMHNYHLRCLKQNVIIDKKNISNDKIIKLNVVEYVSPLSVEELYDIKVEGCEIISATCKPCQLTFYEKTKDIVEDWNEHLTTRRHLEREKTFSEKII